MGRHSRRGPAPKADAADTAAARARESRAGRPDPRRTDGPSQEPQRPYRPQGPHQAQWPHQSQGGEGAAPRGAAPGDVPGARQGYAGPGP
ncbi:hypothetical protein G3I66_41985, partial [Streptomyces rubrogriseus]|nr:hypothetical protein [Streptomyces rubrogriseus]